MKINKFITFLTLTFYLFNLIPYSHVFAQNQAPQSKNFRPEHSLSFVVTDVSQRKADLFNYAMKLRSTVIEQLLITRVALQTYLYTFKGENLSYEEDLLPQTKQALLQNTLPGTASLLLQLDNGGQKLSDEQKNQFLEKSIITSWEVFKYDLTIKRLDVWDRKYDLESSFCETVQVPCVASYYLPNWFDGTYPKTRPIGGYKTIEDNPLYKNELQNFEMRLDLLIEDRKKALGTFQLLGLPMKQPLFSAPYFLLYSHILSEAFDLPLENFKYAPARIHRNSRWYVNQTFLESLKVEQALTRDSFKRVEKAWIVGLEEALQNNKKSLEHLTQDVFLKVAFDKADIYEALEKLAFLSHYSSLKQETIEVFKLGYQKVYIEVLNQELKALFEQQEDSYYTTLYVIIGVSIAATFILGPSSWILAGILIAGSLYAAGSSYLRYTQRASEKNLIASLFYTDSRVSLISEEEFEQAIELSDKSLRDLIIAGISLGLEPLFFIRFMAGVKGLGNGKWLLSKSFFKNLLIRDVPNGKWLPAIERTLLRVKNPVISRINFKTVWQSLWIIPLLWVFLPPRESLSSSPTFGEEIDQYLKNPYNKNQFLSKSLKALSILEKYDEKNNTHLFSLFHVNPQDPYDGVIGIHEYPSTIALSGKFYIHFEIIKNGTAQNIVYEIAEALYIQVFFEMATQEKNSSFGSNSTDTLQEEAEDFARACGGIPFNN
ncbi:MAG: hypothetical protein HYW47_02475 [Deltaproteobacteria bacterium]|nr:hypothetical protein [Deltaproteobacteria bacterium]